MKFEYGKPIEWELITPVLYSSNSFGIIKEEENCLLHFTLQINNEGYGWFEWYDVESGGYDWYCEGGLWIEGNAVVSYDGCFTLSDFICDKLEEIGFDVSEVRYESGD